MEADSECAVLSKVHGKRIALLACGSFNPPTYMHMRMFERARDYLEKTHGCTVVEGILSPVADTSGKSDLLSAEHRLKMAELAVKNSNWIRADGWECSQSEWTRTLHVLHHFKEELIAKYGDGPDAVNLMLLCGGDVVESFTRITITGANLWNPYHVEEIVRDFGLIVLTRANTDPLKAIYLIDLLREHQKNIHVIEDETCPNNVSATRLRIALRRRESIRYCTGDEVIDYIEKHGLYLVPTSSPSLGEKAECTRRSVSSSSIFAEKGVITGKPPQPPKRASSISSYKFQHLLTKHSSEGIKGLAAVGIEEEPVWCTPSSYDERYSFETREREFVPAMKPILTPAEQCIPSTSVERPHTSLESPKLPLPPQTHDRSWMRPLDSPNYENVSLEEILEASTSWAEYLGSKKGTSGSQATATTPLLKTQAAALESTSEVSEKLQQQSGSKYEAALHSLMEPFSKPAVYDLPQDSEGVSKEEIQEKGLPGKRSIRFASVLTRSAEDLSNKSPLEEENSMFRSMTTAKDDNDEEPPSTAGVTLTYRQYKLASTPETTV